MTGVSDERLERALDDATRGCFTAADAVLPTLGQPLAPTAEAWASALLAVRYRAGLEGRPPLPHADPSDLEPAALHAIARNCEEQARAATLLFDDGRARAVMATYAELGERGADPLRRAITRAFVSAIRGDASETLATALRSLGSEAAGRKLSYLVVETTALRALVMLNRSDLVEATTLARRASRMARTEAMPQAEYLANVILARVRRLAGRPHLATRILQSLAKVAPPIWHRWLRWEMIMAAGRRGADALAQRPGGVSRGEARDATPGHCLTAILEAASRGDTARFDDLASALHDLVRSFSPLAFDTANALAVVDPRATSSANQHLDAWALLADWKRGHHHALPLGLSGLAGDDSLEGALASVCAAPETEARRCLHSGRALFAGQALAEKSAVGHGRTGRTETALSVLAFAGRAGLAEEALFRGAYGFEYTRELHRGILGVLVHRARARAQGFAELERERQHITLRFLAPAVLPDPRCAQPVEERVLRFVARTGHSTAKAASQTLGISLRSAQAALQALVEDGSCDRAREGRKIRYLVEDTTFREPTAAE